MLRKIRAADATQGAFVVARNYWLVPPSGCQIVVVPDSEVVERFAAELTLFLAESQTSSSEQSGAERFPLVVSLIPWDVLPFDSISPSIEVSARRIEALDRLLTGDPCLMVTTADALAQSVLAPEVLRSSKLCLSVGKALTHTELVTHLERIGYVRSSMVEELGQIAIKGAVVDIYPPGYSFPLRCEFFGDTLESIRSFDSGTQRSIASIEQASILPVRELLADSALIDIGGAASERYARLKARALELEVPYRVVDSIEVGLTEGLHLPGLEHLSPLLTDELVTPLDYVVGSLNVIIYDRPGVFASLDRFKSLLSERTEKVTKDCRIFPAACDAYPGIESIENQLLSSATLAVDRLLLLDADGLGSADSDLPANWGEIFTLEGLYASLRAARHQERPFKPLADEIRQRTRDGFAVGIVLAHESRESRIRDLLAGYDIVPHRFPGGVSDFVRRSEKCPPGGVWILLGDLGEGFRCVDPALELITERGIFPETASRKESKSARSVRRFIGAATQLQENDFIVHVDHGIGVYRGLKQVTIEGVVGDFLHIEYAEEAKLFLPVDQIGRIQKYAGAEGKRPALSRLGGTRWTQTKAKVKESVAELAGQLLKLLAERELAPGMPFGPPDRDDASFADTFPYEETPDQTRAIADVLSDLAKDRPMDRLVCGDVGYGKTEVAIRATYKAVSSGKQVALLVPTTILADQHYQTFAARFAETPYKVGCVSRFQSTAENRAVIEALAGGRLDIVIGTHRLIQRDVNFVDLGLVIIDEEHRFGVVHKERLKKLRKNVHVLTLTATPIPRTLHLSLVGVRDLSIIETPPTNRQVIRTYVANHSPQLVREAIIRELGRGGQVFYISNRVQNIEAVSEELRLLVPEAKVVFAHGQMRESELERIMHSFVVGEADVLVSTTIVESGLDIPNANTIIIGNAEMFGLAELYQLRGRVGRSSRRAYAYLLIPDPKTLGAEAKKRLDVLQSLDDLGIGFRLAIQDMEIRGAGNLLGQNQSGHIELVGFELYSRILKEAVEELKLRGERGLNELAHRIEIDPELRIGFPAYIPPWYVPNVAERVLLYQRLIEIRDEQEGALMFEEIVDRFGSAPAEVPLLIESMVFRGQLRKAGVVAATFKDNRFSMTFHPELAPSAELIVGAVAAFGDSLRVSPKKAISYLLSGVEIRSPKDLQSEVQQLLDKLGKS